VESNETIERECLESLARSQARRAQPKPAKRIVTGILSFMLALAIAVLVFMVLVAADVVHLNF
jgi:hypothetical protein